MGANTERKDLKHESIGYKASSRAKAYDQGYYIAASHWKGSLDGILIEFNF